MSNFQPLEVEKNKLKYLAIKELNIHTINIKSLSFLFLSSSMPLINTILILETLKYFGISHGDQRAFSIRNHHKYLSQFFPLHLNTYVLALLPLLVYFQLF